MFNLNKFPSHKNFYNTMKIQITHERTLTLDIINHQK